MKAILVRTNNTYSVMDVEDPAKLIDGYSEMVTPAYGYNEGLMPKDNAFLCDEEGLIKELKPNQFGSILYGSLVSSPYHIVGDIVIVGLYYDLATYGIDVRGLTFDEIKHYKKEFKNFGIKEK